MTPVELHTFCFSSKNLFWLKMVDSMVCWMLEKEERAFLVGSFSASWSLIDGFSKKSHSITTFN